jgi:hypothetical protein
MVFLPGSAIDDRDRLFEDLFFFTVSRPGSRVVLCTPFAVRGRFVEETRTDLKPACTQLAQAGILA